MQNSRPKQVTADRNQGVLIISWDDGHESRYPFAGLRAVCPCVDCRGGHQNMGQPPDPRVVRDTPPLDIKLEGLDAAGAYAIQMRWSDGHATGIYSWEMLRNACPCEICLST